MNNINKRTCVSRKGITLITLVITVVVLMILAGVSINAILGDDGIIEKAEERAEETKQTTIKDELNRMVLEFNLAKNDETMYEYFEEKKAEGKISDVIQNDDGTITIKKDGYGITVKPPKKSILDDLQIGDYVNYTYDTASDYTLESTYSGYSSNQTIAQTTGLKWKVLNVDKENDTVDIISENPTSATAYFYGILGYNNGPYLMNEICKAQYSNKTLGTEARSINLLDMEKHLTSTGITARNAWSTAVQYGKTKTYTGSYSYYPKLYANQTGAGINTTNVEKPTITGENANPDPYNESETGTTGLTTDSTPGQATSSGLTVTQTFYNITINSDNYGTAAAVLSNSNAYWVAARYLGTYSDGAYFSLGFAYTDTLGYDLFHSDSRSYASDSCCFRPVVSLSSSIFTGTKDSSRAWNLKQSSGGSSSGSGTTTGEDNKGVSAENPDGDIPNVSGGGSSSSGDTGGPEAGGDGVGSSGDGGGDMDDY